MYLLIYIGTVFEFGYVDGYDMVNQPKNVGNSLYLGLIQTKDNSEEAIYHLMLESDIRVGYKEVEGKTTLDDYLIKDSFFPSFKKFLEKIASYDMQANIAVNSFNSKLYGNVLGSTKSAQSDRTRHSNTPTSRRPPRQVPTVNTFSSEEVADDTVDEFIRRTTGGINVGEDVDITLEAPTTKKVDNPRSLNFKADFDKLDENMQDVPNFEND